MEGGSEMEEMVKALNENAKKTIQLGVELNLQPYASYETEQLYTTLVQFNIECELYPFVVGDKATLAIYSPSYENCLVEAVSSELLYEGAEDLLRVKGAINPKLPKEQGYLTWDEAFRFFVTEKQLESWEKHKNLQGEGMFSCFIANKAAKAVVKAACEK